MMLNTMILQYMLTLLVLDQRLIQNIFYVVRKLTDKKILQLKIIFQNTSHVKLIICLFIGLDLLFVLIGLHKTQLFVKIFHFHAALIL